MKELIKSVKRSREKRLGKTACKCFDIFEKYKRGEITEEEMRKRLEDLENKQLGLFGRLKKTFKRR
jgi:uncharacterized membrane protein